MTRTVVGSRRPRAPLGRRIEPAGGATGGDGGTRAPLLGAAAALALACAPAGEPAGTDGAVFGRTPDGVEVEMFTLGNENGIEIVVIEYGAILQAIRVPDGAGGRVDIALGHDSLAGYVKDSPYFGAIVGRYANRIAGGRFTLDGETHELARNDGPNHLHGGERGFDRVVWEGRALETDEGDTVELRHTSPAGEEGYPGTLEVVVTYTLTDADELVVDYRARTDAPTPVNLSQHTYFNLAGAGSGDILDHVLTIHGDAYTPVDSTLIPNGEIVPVEGTPFDFRSPTPIGARIGADHPQLAHGGGYDHNFVLRRPPDGATGPAPAARVVDPASGRWLDVRTTEPGLQFYSGNFLDGSIRGKDGRVYRHRGAFCLETQHYPDSPNREAFPSTILQPGEEYRSRSVYAFGW